MNSEARLSGSPLSRYLCGAYLLLIAYASLHPLTGWSALGVEPFEFLRAPPPRYMTGFDIVANIAVYVPLGALLVLAFYPRIAGLSAWLLAIVCAAGLSLGLETLQNYLPARIASNVDLALNVVGAANGGVLGLALVRAIMVRGVLYAYRYDTFYKGKRTDAGLVLIAGWLLAQLNPETLLFGNGDLRALFQGASSVLYPPATFVRVEMLVTAAHTLALGLMLSLLLHPGTPKRRLFLMLVGTACLIRSIAFAVLFAPEMAFSWFTQGAAWGLAIGLVAAFAGMSLKRGYALGVCGLSLMAATALVNLAPDNPYLANSLQLWGQGHFLNFNGFTRLVSVLWPFAAMAYLFTARPYRPRPTLDL